VTGPSEAQATGDEAALAESAAAAGRPWVPGYEILAELGRGGMGVVYQARQLQLRRVVALKMVLAGAHSGEADRARFRTEAEAIARLQHSNIVQVHEVGEHAGTPFLALEFCAGGSLEAKLTGTPWPGPDAAVLVEKLARAMDVAHHKGIVHRDLKPANILLQRKSEAPHPKSEKDGKAGSDFGFRISDFEPKVTDFGLARKLDEAGQTVTGAILGTPPYMAPEQAEGSRKAIGPATDVYALGAILYELLTGRPPFRASTHLDTILQVVSQEPVPVRHLQPRTPRDLETICLKCLEKQPSKRYATALELAEDLRRFKGGEPIQARPIAAWEQAVKWAKRRPAVAGLSAALLLLAGLEPKKGNAGKR
jgi:serine/threonine protein kinase